VWEVHTGDSKRRTRSVSTLEQSIISKQAMSEHIQHTNPHVDTAAYWVFVVTDGSPLQAGAGGRFQAGLRDLSHGQSSIEFAGLKNLFSRYSTKKVFLYKDVLSSSSSFWAIIFTLSEGLTIVSRSTWRLYKMT
jgi:hypothetical protein